MEEAVLPHGARKRQRASIACQSCNSKRVKCNTATIGLPCSNCRRVGIDCRLIESRRGKRQSRGDDRARTQDRHEPSVPQGPETQIGDRLLLGSQASEKASSSDNMKSATTIGEQHGIQVGECTSDHNSSSELQYYPSRNLEASTALGGAINKSLNGISEGHQTSAMLFEQTVESNEPRHSFTRLDEPVLYTGYAFNLTYVLRQTLAGDETTLEDRSTYHGQLVTDNTDSNSLRPAKKDYDLRQFQNAFDVPKSHVYLALIKTFFEYVAPHYPIIDRRSFVFQYAIPQRPPSWLLLQAVLFMAAGHCDEKLLIETGFKSRHDARVEFFKRTRAFYDADLEKNKVTIVQTVFLMSFWWPARDDSKDTWHWLGIAISLALTIGMHRSTKNLDMPLREKRLWKKIWWSLFTEDKHAAAALGRPVHIRLNDCDVEPLEVSDFEGEPFGFGDDFQAGLPKVVSCYPICLSGLSKILERIIEKPSQTYLPHKNSLELCEGMMQVWEIGLPEHLSLGHPEMSHTIWPSMLHIAAWILARSTHTSGTSSTPSRDYVNEKAKKAANQMIQLVEDLLATGRIQHCPIHIIPALFTAMNIYVIEMRAGDRVSEQLAHVKIKTCMIALRELQSSWPISGWIILFFSNIVNGVQGKIDPESNIEARSERPQG